MTKSRYPLIVVSAPSGAGKSSLVARAIADFPVLVDSISYTTRSQREGEQDGNPYIFVSPEKFEELIQQGFFVEWAKVHGKYYGTPRYQVDEALAQGKFLIMDVDVKGAHTFRGLYPNATFIFILPPSIDELRRRLERRDRGRTQDLELRMKNAQAELKEADKFEFQLVNSDFEQSYQAFKKIIEEVTRKR